MIFPQGLEERARGVVLAAKREKLSSYSQVASVVRELELALAALQALRVLHRGLERSLGESECVVGTELSRPYGQVLDYEWKLRERLLTIRAERRRWAVSRFESFSALARRVLELLNRYEVLRP